MYYFYWIEFNRTNFLAMDILKRLSARLQTVNEQLGQLNAYDINTDIIREEERYDWQNGKPKELDITTDENGTFIINF